MLEEEGMIVLPALEEISKEFFDAVEFLKKFNCTETEIHLNKALSEGKKYWLKDLRQRCWILITVLTRM
jgi:adenylosuccinate synthase